MAVVVLLCVRQGLETPLIYASWEGRLETVKLLISRGAALNVQNDVSAHHIVTTLSSCDIF
jgi:ankyrin repeat protein